MRCSGRAVFQKHGDACLADFPFSYADDQVDELVLVGLNFDVVRVEKRQCGRQCRSFVAVNEGMIAADTVQVRGRHLEDRFVKEDASEGCLDIAHRREEETCVANAGGASEQTDLLFVSDKDFVESEKKKTHYSLRRRNTPAYF